jgi:hypothetical protein
MPSSRNFFEDITAASPCALALLGERGRARARSRLTELLH